MAFANSSFAGVRKPARGAGSPRTPQGGKLQMGIRQQKGNSEHLPLVVLTINLQYYASWPKDEEKAQRRLLEIVSAEPRPDVVCVQEGLHGRDVLKQVGYHCVVSSGTEAQSVHAMVYGHEATLAGIPEAAHEQLLINEVYVRDGASSWEVVDQGVVKTASGLSLVGGEGVSGPLATRSVVWTRLRQKGRPGSPAAVVLNTHLSGGRFEDQFFVQQLSQERHMQVDRSLDVFADIAEPQDLGIMVGDFNATTDDRAAGPVRGYFRSAISSSSRVQEDAKAAGIPEGELEGRFREYMAAPFAALQRRGWTLAYSQDDVGPTSAFGHCVDHMATNRPVQARAEVFQTTRQRFGAGAPDNEFVQLTDHNAVKVVFEVPTESPPESPTSLGQMLQGFFTTSRPASPSRSTGSRWFLQHCLDAGSSWLGLPRLDICADAFEPQKMASI